MTLSLQWTLPLQDSSMTSETLILSPNLMRGSPPPPTPGSLRVVCGLLKGHRVVLVTHQLQFAQLADNILAIKDVS